ncbi:hypothetical protein DAEQUDRAFT_759657 [Daedalea quercina L-15889]|uniref:Rho-GAP domain-containing protein n=1 Tax=Daedalea quercina L-15889 TaxID=1314783 RepID=A0A165LUJ4_9APHY|nr:hypothetical protein DAEQUDRAFT_759657 [Daedalea quercina L-15889]
MRSPFSLRSRSLTPEPDSVSQAASGKQRSASLDATLPHEPVPPPETLRASIANPSHRDSSPARGILKKPSLQPDAHPCSVFGEEEVRRSDPPRSILKKPSIQAQAQGSASAPFPPKPERKLAADPSPKRRTNERARPQSSSDPVPQSTPLPEILSRPRHNSRADSEEDYVARACGQLPPFTEQPMQRGRSSTLPSAPSDGFVAQSSDDSDTDGKPPRRQRGRTTSGTGRKSHMRARSTSPSHEKPTSGEGTSGKKSSVVPRLPLQIADWTDVMHDLSHLLHERGFKFGEHVDLDEFTARKDFEREAREHYLKHKDDPPEPPEKEPNSDKKPPRIYQMTMLEVMEVSSTTIIMNGYQHDLPTVMYECVEELYRTGIYKDNLFRASALKHNVDKMRRIFDRGYKRPMGERVGPLAKWPTADICGLLVSMIENLPEPILPRDLNTGLWQWCVSPVLKREWDILFPPVVKRRRKTMWGTVPKMESVIIEDPNLTPEERRAVREAFDAPMVELCQYVLRLMSVEHLSLFAYLFDFFRQLLAYPANGLDAEFLGERFGYYMLGGTSFAAGRTLFVWLLDRWERISKGLLDIAPSGTRRYKEQKSDLARLRRQEAYRQKYAVSPHQPYNEADPCHDAESGSSASSNDSARTYVDAEDGYDDARSASVLDYYLGDDVDRRGSFADRAYPPKPRRRSESRGRSEARRSRRVVDEDDDDLVAAARRIAELERELQRTSLFRQFLRRPEKSERKRRDPLDQDCDDYSNYF